MKKTLIISSLALGCLALAASLVLAPKVQAAPSQTAQSVMVNTSFDSGAYVIEGTITWTFDKDCAEANYTASAGVWDGNEPTCSGSNANCASTNKPAVPPAPAVPSTGPDSIKNHAQDDHCTYFCGGTLSGWAYTDTSTVNGLNGKGNWTFTYNYSSSPNTATVDAHTCWTSEETGGTVDVGFSGFISSESYLKQTSRDKYSFTLTEPDGLGGTLSRVQNVSAQLQKFDGTNWNNVGDPIAYGTLPVTATAADYEYFGNGGVFGNSAVYSALHATGGGKAATNVSAILLEDNFANNDNDLVNGNVHEADYNGSFPGISEAGDYRVQVSGTIKGNAGAVGQQFSVTSSQLVIGGCPCP